MKGSIFSDPDLYCRSRWSDWSKGSKEKRDHFSILGERSSGNNLQFMALGVTVYNGKAIMKKTQKILKQYKINI